MPEYPANGSRDDHEPERTRAAPSPPSPRAAAISIGYVFQGVGLVLMSGACCFGAFSTHLLERSEQPALRWTDYLAEMVADQL